MKLILALKTWFDWFLTGFLFLDRFSVVFKHEGLRVIGYSVSRLFDSVNAFPHFDFKRKPGKEKDRTSAMPSGDTRGAEEHLRLLTQLCYDRCAPD